MSPVARSPSPCLEDHLPGVFPIVLDDVDTRTAGRGFHGGREPRQLREELAGEFRRASTVLNPRYEHSEGARTSKIPLSRN